MQAKPSLRLSVSPTKLNNLMQSPRQSVSHFVIQNKNKLTWYYPMQSFQSQVYKVDVMLQQPPYKSIYLYKHLNHLANDDHVSSLSYSHHLQVPVQKAALRYLKQPLKYAAL